MNLISYALWPDRTFNAGFPDVMKARGLVIADKVTTYGDFGKRSDFRIKGDLNNYGMIVATSRDADITRGVIAADNIVNHESGSVTSDVDLTLQATKNLSNFGTITSARGLNLVAGGVIDNRSAIKATNNVVMTTPDIRNHGSIESANGSVDLVGVPTATLTVDNTDGLFAAQNGAINVRTFDYNAIFDSNIVGGDWISREVNLNSGLGTANLDVRNITGTVNETGTAAHVVSATELLTIGSVCLNGDPCYYNSLGSISIVGDVTSPASLAFIAAGDITCSDGITLRAASDTKGNEITLIAGADFTTDGGGLDSPVVPPTDGAGARVFLSGQSSKQR